MRCQKIIVVLVIFITAMNGFVAYADTQGQATQFFVNPKFDISGRNRLTATLRLIGARAYFYIDDQYYNNLSATDQNMVNNNLTTIAQEFDTSLYPKETNYWGHENTPGIDGDSRITILFEQLTHNAGGYFDGANSYPIKNYPASNQREMLAINTESLESPTRKPASLISHELQHLISTNQKELTRSINEDTWLNELRSEYAIELVELNDPYDRSSLQSRVREFLQNPSDSLTEWLNQAQEYGAVALFGEYLAEQYGPALLKDSLQNSLVGIASINDYLQQKHYQESFGDVFANWTVTNYLNDLSVDPHFGYQKPGLQALRVTPLQNTLFYPFDYNYNYQLKPWQPTWYKFNLDASIPKTKGVKVKLRTNSNFGLIYIDNLNRKQFWKQLRTCNSEKCDDAFYVTNSDGQLSNFTLMPYNTSKTSQFTDSDPAASLDINLSFVDEVPLGATVVGTVSKIANNAALLPDGSLIKKTGGSDLYVLTGPYKRYLSPQAIALYGHLDPTKAYEVTPAVFDSFPTSNYIRIVNTSQIYAVWPDNTKHLFRVSFIKSGRDPKLIFTINPLEFNIYQSGQPILK